MININMHIYFIMKYINETKNKIKIMNSNFNLDFFF